MSETHYLVSDAFEQATTNFDGSVAGMRCAVERFEQAVAKLATIMAMQAENQIRMSQGKALAYDEAAFFNA